MKLNIDGVIEIATGASRKEKAWKNKQIKWSEFLNKISTTTRTAETYAEYMKAIRSRQDEIKDVGGFVGGYIQGGRRKNGSIATRSLVVLDADFGPPGLWEDFVKIAGWASAMYTTHKHSAEKPRVRLIIPLATPVSVEQYEPLARMLAWVLNIERFDHTCYEPTRLMYWPSTSKDGEFLFQYQDGFFLDPAEILGKYKNYKDSSEWPLGDREIAVVKKAIKSQENPLDKKGVIGAFCRTYGMCEVIETFLSDVYTECDVEDRYTYTEGSTAAGLVVYEDKFAYSHHGTDPISGMLCNAFDLVRVHKFVGLDEKLADDVPTNKRPSQKAMEDFALGLSSVRALVTQEKNAEADYDFKDVEIEPEAAAPELSGTEGSAVSGEKKDDWRGRLKMDKKCNIYSTVENMVTILENDRRLKGRFVFDEFAQRRLVVKNLPWRKVTAQTGYVTDMDENKLYHYLEKVYGIQAVKLEQALGCIYQDNRIHPIRAYLSGLEWDGKRRVDRLLIDYMGAADTEYVRAVTRKTLVAAVARIFVPGIKFDNVLTLIGAEGRYKSTLFNKLGGPWFNDNFNFSMVHGKEGCEQIQGKWIVEIGEMMGYKKAEQETVKNFLSRREDSYRPAYGRNTVTLLRQCIFVGTTNDPDFLRNNDGNRRFWPVAIDEIECLRDVVNDLSADEVGQLWAEAREMYLSGEDVHLPPALEAEARTMQKEHTEEHPWTGVIRNFLEMPLPKTWEKKTVYERMAYMHEEEETREAGYYVRNKVCVSELWCEALGKPEKDMNYLNARDLHSIMRSLPEWEISGTQLRFGRYGMQRKGYKLKKANEIMRYVKLLNE